MDWFWRLLCKIESTHSPSAVSLPPLGITPESRCKFCSSTIWQDGQGNWYRPDVRKPRGE